VINKPAGLVVHPAAGHADGTLLNALHHVPDIVNVPRAGIVHRLDKDTTGLMVVAKTIQAQTKLVHNAEPQRQPDLRVHRDRRGDGWQDQRRSVVMASSASAWR
jgi:23S rRNA-/tRNA-specific pseudouridylate synthase